MSKPRPSATPFAHARRVSTTLVAAGLWTACAASSAAETIDLDNLPNYANQAKPAYITKDNTTAGNAITNRGATLGRVLFYDKKLSITNSVSCASCHQQSKGFADSATASTGVNGTTGRHSMRLINIRFANEAKMFWDERAATVEAQATQPIRDHAEMGWSGTLGDPAFADLVAKMEGINYYPTLFTAAYGDPAITEDRIQRAIAQFVRSIQAFDTKYDVGRAQVANDNVLFPNFTPEEHAGKMLFLQAPVFQPGTRDRIGGGAGCAGCHRPPEFDVDPNTRSNGVITKIGGGQDLTNVRSPTLRNMTDAAGNPHGGFMHDGSFASLAAMVNHYNSPPDTLSNPAIRPSIDPRIFAPGTTQTQRLNLTGPQIANLVAFMQTLSSQTPATDPKWSNPFDSNGNLSIAQLEELVNGMAVY